MKKTLPLVKLPKGYYDVNTSLTSYNKYWTPWNFPPRKNKLILGLLFDWILMITLYILVLW